MEIDYQQMTKIAHFDQKHDQLVQINKEWDAMPTQLVSKTSRVTFQECIDFEAVLGPILDMQHRIKMRKYITQQVKLNCLCDNHPLHHNPLS